MRHEPVPFVGRRTEIAAIRAQAEVLTHGQGGTVLVVGEAGAGKSALLRYVFAVPDPAHRMLWAAGDELSQVFPLLPFVAVVDGPRRAEISALLRGGTAVVDPSIATTEELVGWVEDLCAGSPVVLVFDDLHWADPASVRLWNRLTLLAEQMPLLVVGSMRPVEDRTDLTAIKHRVAKLADAGRGVLAELTPLSATESADLVSVLAGGAPGEKLAGFVEVTAGNPLYLTELISALDREGALESAGGVVEVMEGKRPDSLFSAMTTRLDTVPPDVRDLLRLAALLGTDFELSDLAIVSGRPVADLFSLLSRAQSAGILTTTRTGMAFRHPLIREALCAQVPGRMRAAWHQEVGRTLAGAGQPPAAVARQLLAAIEAGGDLSGQDWLINWLVSHGETLANQSTAAVKSLFTPVLTKVPLTDPRRAAVVVPLAAALLRTNDLTEAERIASQTLENLHDLDADTTFSLRSVLFECYSDTNFAKALAVAGDLESDVDLQERHRLHARVLRARVIAASRQPEAEQIGLAALEAARRAADLMAMAGSYHALAVTAKARGDLPASLAHAEHGIALVADDPTAVDLHLHLLWDQSIALAQLCEWDRARESVAMARKIAERVGNERKLNVAVAAGIGYMFFSGRWDELLAEADTADHVIALGSGFCAASVVAFHRDDPTAARRYLGIAEGILSSNPTGPAGHQYAAFVRGLELEYTGDLDAAFVHLRDAALTLWTSADVPTAHVVGLGMRLGRRADAEKVAEFAETKAVSAVRDQLVPHCRGLVESDPDLLDEAASGYRAKGLKLGQAMACEAAGLAWASRGDSHNARRAMTEALETYESLGAAWDISRTRAAFRAHGMRTRSRSARPHAVTGWQSLTSTETKIANMVAEGLSNRLIADQLFISRRTVDTHMSHILRKLGSRSRVEVATEALARR